MIGIKHVSDKPVFYKNIQMMTAPGVHEEVGRLVERYIPEEKRGGLKALDLAAGQGALSLRLHDLGFKNLTAWELESDRFIPKDIPVNRVDLNLNFPSQTKYDLITAIEIIEHLENPFHFMRQIKSSLARNGVAVLSTPNIESALSRIQFLANGRFRWFSDGAYQEWGHIKPISTWELGMILAKSQLMTVERSSNSKDVNVVEDGQRKYSPKVVAAAMLFPFMRGSKDGDINLWVIQHADEPHS